MYNRYIRNDQGTYTRIPEEEPRHTQGGTSPSGQPEHPPSGGGQQPPHWAVSYTHLTLPTTERV